jgi:hypothetical protein
MANSKQSDKLGLKEKETGSAAFVGQADSHLPGSHQSRKPGVIYIK